MTPEPLSNQIGGRRRRRRKRRREPEGMSLAYSRKVSFDSLAPHTPTEPDEPLFIPLQYVGRRKSASLNLDFGFEAKRKVDVNDLISSFGQISAYGGGAPSAPITPIVIKRAPKLPPPPERSSLKRFAASTDGVKTTTTTMNSLSGNAIRKKSLVEMTDEEIMALDSQFRQGIALDKLKFDGDGYLPSIASLSSLETRRMSKAINVDKVSGQSVMSGNKRLLTPSIANYNSYATTYTHNEMGRYIDKKMKLFNMDDDSKKMGPPTSIRELAVYVSGRRHTWAALDWTLKEYLQDGDHLVVLSQIPDKVAVDPRNYYEADENMTDDILPAYEYVDVDKYYGAEGIKEEAHRLNAYIFKALQLLEKQDLKVSITVELIKERDVGKLLSNGMALYMPNVFLASTLVTKYIVMGKNSRLPFFVSAKLNVPTIVIPDQLMNDEPFKLAPNVPRTIPDSPLQDINKFVDSLDPKEGYDFIYEPIPDLNVRSRYLFNPYRNDGYSTGTASSTVTTDGEASTPTDYFGLTQPKIKFSGTLHVPRAHNGGSSSLSGGSSRRNSHGSGVYKVKSLLDGEPTPVERSKSYSTPITNSLSNGSSTPIARKGSRGSIVKKVKSEPAKVEKKGLFGLFRRKK